jgi:hypothetical protein
MMMTEHKRAIGLFGTLARVAVGIGLLVLTWLYDTIQWSDILLGLVAFPAVAVLFQWLRLRSTPDPLRATGPLGHLVNFGIGAVLLVTPFTNDAASLFYGTSMLLAAARGYAGCEVLAISNTLLRRDDVVGCALFFCVDAIEAPTTGRSGTTVQP